MTFLSKTSSDDKSLNNQRKMFFFVRIQLFSVFNTKTINSVYYTSVLTLPMPTVFWNGKEASLRFRQLEISVQRHKSLRPFEATNGH